MHNPGVEPVNRRGGGPGAQAVVIALGVLGLLALVALGARNRGWGGGGSGGTSGLPLSFWDTVFSVLAVSSWSRRRSRSGCTGSSAAHAVRAGTRSGCTSLAAIFFIATMIGLALAYEHWGRGHARLLHRPAQLQAPRPAIRTRCRRGGPGRRSTTTSTGPRRRARSRLLIAFTVVMIERERAEQAQAEGPRRAAVEALAARSTTRSTTSAASPTRARP